ncbi:hypothetical protein BN439_1309 [Erwinia amylovora Ea644]|nr:hypothetical protein BN439_1309 [Erwinia amylovora Ea644]
MIQEMNNPDFAEYGCNWPALCIDLVVFVRGFPSTFEFHASAIAA